tara:strand:- start:1711 stop:1878 length:168 start_codon:yes stop_codon:yes gene_type:complete
MELLIAVLIAFGTISSNDASSLSKADAEKLVQESKISKADLDKQASIIGLEESDY